MFADDLVDQYWKLGVSTPAGPVTISCNRYLMNGDSAQAQQAKIQDVRSQAPAKKPGIFVDGAAFTRTYYGKGLPSDLQHVLQVGVDSGVLPSDKDALQGWADSSLGVDCTGFVSAYHFQCAMMPLGQGVNAGCAYFYSIARRLHPQSFIVWTLDEVQPDDVMVWMNENGVETKSPGHIAKIVGKMGNSLKIAESSGADDGQGHRGPHLNQKMWDGTTQKKGGQCLNIGEGVIIIRTINY